MMAYRLRGGLVIAAAMLAAACGPAPQAGSSDAASSETPAPAQEIATVANDTTPAVQTPNMAPNGPLTIAAIRGDWRVTKVLLAGDGVQALMEDDPAYLNRVIRIGDQALEWRAAPAAATAAQTDQCDGPQLVLAADVFDHALAPLTRGAPIKGLIPADTSGPAYEVRCADGVWGPDASGSLLSRTPDGRLVLSWYDNAILVLTRTG